MTWAMALIVASAGVTAGWENVEPQRQEMEPAKVLWRAPLAQAEQFRIEKRDGAEGRVEFKDGRLLIDKTNDRGMIVVTAPAFVAVTNQPIRFMADVHCDRGDYLYAQAGIRAYDAAESLSPYWELELRHFSMGGAEEMHAAVQQAPGMFNRKYCHLRVKSAAGRVTPVLVVSGTASRTLWKDWLAEDLDAADQKWAGYYEARTSRDHASERMEESEFDRALAADTDHWAAMVRTNGVTRLVIDGEIAYPGAYRAKGAFGRDVFFETFAGGPMVREGVKLVVKGIAMGGADDEIAKGMRRYWSERGFDAVGAVRDIKNSLRLAPGALCILSVSCNAYPNFTLKEHPKEAWVRRDGTVVRGTSGSCVDTYDDMGIKDTNRWPWISYASPSWRAAVKRNLQLLVDELRRQGLLKRIVGLHLTGYHDGQFHSPYEDHSWMAKQEFEKYLKEDPLAVNDLDYFSKLLGFKAQEDFARAFKRMLGKPAVVIRWNMGAFSGMPDLTAFAFSDAVDIIVPQPTYETRRPGMVAEMKLPYSSFDLHGKMYWNEFDLRTYGALETWATPGVVATKGLGQSDDFTMWQSVYHKFAGMMFAHNSGYWFYDMGGGWFSPPEIARSIGEVFRCGRKILAKPAHSNWQPSVAVVADEEGMGVNRAMNGAILRDQQKPLAAAGVPFRFYLAEDVLREPKLLTDCNTVILAFFRKFDARRERLYRELSKDGRTLIFLSETAIDGGADLIGFKPSYDRSKQSLSIVAEPGTDPEEMRSYLDGLHKRHWPTGSAHGERCSLAETPEQLVLARYATDRAVAIAERRDAACRRIYVATPAALTAKLFNRLARESGAYVPVAGGGELQIDMNGDFVSCHALTTGEWKFRLPFPAMVTNLRSGEEEAVRDGAFALRLTAGETAWFRLDDLRSGGETLYNGIRLPNNWPPCEVKSNDRTVRRVPYLEQRPQVVPINVGRQLFVDDFLIERTDMRRRFHYPEKYAGNPILKPETPLEINRPSNSCARALGGVWWDPKRQRYRMWYEAGWLNVPAYAESEDGLKWQRVNLDIVPGTNRVFPEGTVRFDSWTITPDFKAADPYANWLLFVRPPGPSAQLSFYATSPDGIHWSELKPGGKCGDRSTLFFNPFRRKWVWSLRSEMGPWGLGGTRARSYREADDFIQGSLWDFKINDSTAEAVQWLQPDADESRDPKFKLLPQFYNIDAVAYESIMLGGFEVWKGPENNEIIKSGLPKILDLEFAYSRDGFHFSRPDRTPAIASERWEAKSWDSGYVQSIANLMVVKDEQLLFYYSACAGNPKRLEVGGFSADLNGAYDQGATGVAILRRDGFASLTPAVGCHDGELVTRPLTFDGKFLFVNAKLPKGAELRTEMTDRAGRPLPGYGLEDSVPLVGDHVKQLIVWKSRRDLDQHKGEVVRFRFVLRNCALDQGDFYAFWVSPSEKGESRGYLGGGGPAYHGVRDL